MSDPLAHHPLDRPVWSALTTRQAHLAPAGDLARRYPVDVGPLAGTVDDSAEALAALVELIAPGDDLSLMQAAPPPPPEGVVATGAAVLQMVWERFSPQPSTGFAIELLGEADAAEMLELALLTKPGPFRTRTHTVGQFLGVREGGRLIAMAGDRIKLTGYSEVSGVCTHPDHRGRGLGAALMRAVGARMLDEGNTPILHTYAANTGAVVLYRKLGFEVRTEMVHAVWKRV